MAIQVTDSQYPRYVISLLANLNARNTGRTDRTVVSNGINLNGETSAMGRRLSTLVFTPGARNAQTRSGANVTTNTRGGVLSFIRSVGRSIHNDLTRDSSAGAASFDRESQSELAHEGSLNASHEKAAAGSERVSFLL
jgi:hypothetical protein